jgi:Uncharacterized protein conserved in bacteria (DUF2252)
MPKCRTRGLELSLTLLRKHIANLCSNSLRRRHSKSGTRAWTLTARSCASTTIEDHPPLIYHFDAKSEKSQKIHANAAFSNRRSLLPERRALVERYTLRDLAVKVVGVGSVGILCAIGLFMTPDEEPLFLQVKEALCPVLEKIFPPPEGLRQQGNRVVEGQRKYAGRKRCLSRLD